MLDHKLDPICLEAAVVCNVDKGLNNVLCFLMLIPPMLGLLFPDRARFKYLRNEII